MHVEEFGESCTLVNQGPGVALLHYTLPVEAEALGKE